MCIRPRFNALYLQLSQPTIPEDIVKSKSLLLCLTALLVISGCGSEPQSTTTAESAAPVASAAPPSADALTGTWTGDWGPSANDRNMVTVELKWDGSALTGTVNPGPQAVPLAKASYAADTGTIMMEADAVGHGGEKVHYVIEGKVEGTTMSGSWTHENRTGDFKISKT
jgi:hypothetical protein